MLQEGSLKDIVKTSKARAQIIKMISDMVLTKRELAKSNIVNLRGKKMQAVFKLLINIVKDSIESTPEIEPEQRELFFSNLNKNLQEFEDRAEEVMGKVEED